jgi:hypothetical protein
MIDSCNSAFKGKNASDCELGRFIGAVENKLIPDNSWLVGENLNRSSREAILSALTVSSTSQADNQHTQSNRDICLLKR